MIIKMLNFFYILNLSTLNDDIVFFFVFLAIFNIFIAFLHIKRGFLFKVYILLITILFKQLGTF